VADCKNGNTESCKDLHDWMLVRLLSEKMVYFESEQRAMLSVKCFECILMLLVLIFSKLYIALKIGVIW